MTTKSVATAAALGLLVLLAGCETATTSVRFETPQPATIQYAGQSYPLPATIDLMRPTSDTGSVRSRLVLQTAGPDGKEMVVNGIVEAYGYKPTDIDLLAVNGCKINESAIKSIANGEVITITGMSASQQKLYVLNLGLGKGQ
ncbi:MAG: hypothetical protein BIFFINMI_01091 [Phycisphaerae bacterium]|nr:hypothetical protein [Phycisphaerae bacterium]